MPNRAEKRAAKKGKKPYRILLKAMRLAGKGKGTKRKFQ